MTTSVSNSSNTPIARLVSQDHHVVLQIYKQQELVLGRHKSLPKECRFADPRISGTHCRIFASVTTTDDKRECVELYVTDESTNGTFLNGKKISKGSKAKLSDGDIISLGPQPKQQKQQPKEEAEEPAAPVLLPCFMVQFECFRVQQEEHETNGALVGSTSSSATSAAATTTPKQQENKKSKKRSRSTSNNNNNLDDIDVEENNDDDDDNDNNKNEITALFDPKEQSDEWYVLKWTKEQVADWLAREFAQPPPPPPPPPTTAKPSGESSSSNTAISTPTTSASFSFIGRDDLSVYCKAFTDNEITGSVLVDLTARELREDLGIAKLGHRKAIVAAIARLKASRTEQLQEEVQKKQKRESEEEEMQRRRRKEQEELDRALAERLQPKQCMICFDEMEIDFMHPLHGGCNHEFCRDCLHEYFVEKINSGELPIPCPYPKCNTDVSVEDLELILEPEYVELFQNKSFNCFLEKNSKDFSCCPTPDCGYVFFYNEGDDDFQCEKCHKRYCLKCKVPYHEGSTCEQYQRWAIDNGLSDDLFSDFIRGSNFKMCPGCRRWVEKTVGCDHMTCRCGTEFCYKCGGRYRRCECVGGEDYYDEDEDGSDEDDDYSYSDDE